MHGGRHVLSHRGVLTTEEWRDGYKQQAMERALRTRRKGTGGAGTATRVAHPALTFRISVFSPLLSVDNAVCGSAGLVPNAADGIIRKQSICCANLYHTVWIIS